MPKITDKAILRFEKDFTELMNFELGAHMWIESISLPFVKNLLVDFYQKHAGQVLLDGNNAFYFFEIVGHPYNHDVDMTAEGWDWAKNLFNYTLRKVAVEKVEDTLSLSLIRVFYILWYGLQTNTIDEELLMNHFVEIWGFFDTEMPTPLITYSFLKKYYPVFDNEDIKNNLHLALELEHPNIVNEIFDC